MACLLLQELRDARHADLHFQRRRDAIEGLQAAARGILSMLMQIDEARRDDQAFDVEYAFAGKLLRRDARDPALGDAYIADGIDARLRIHHAPAVEHDVVIFRERRRGENKRNCQNRRN